MPREPYPGYYREDRCFYVRTTALVLIVFALALSALMGCAHIPPETYCGKPGGGPLFGIDCPLAGED